VDGTMVGGEDAARRGLVREDDHDLQGEVQQSAAVERPSLARTGSHHSGRVPRSDRLLRCDGPRCSMEPAVDDG
jgi:hypothetical protein